MRKTHGRRSRASSTGEFIASSFPHYTPARRLSTRHRAGDRGARSADATWGTFMHAFGTRLAAASCAIAALCASDRTRAADAQDILTYRGADREQRILAGARKEGEVVLYTGLVVNVALRPLAQAFQAKYPFLKLTYLRADSEGIATRVSAEIRADHSIGDVIEGTGMSAETLGAGLVQPFYSPMAAAFPPSMRDDRNLTAPTRVSYFDLAYNTKLVPADKAPSTYEGLLDPMWKGKMAWRVATDSGAPLFLTNLRIVWGEDRAMDYFKKLAGQKITNYAAGSARALLDRVIAGEYPIALNMFAQFPMVTAAQGAPVASKLLGPVVSTAATISVPKNIRHPNAALLLVDFILSPEGQSVLAKSGDFPSRPDTPPIELLAPADPHRANVPVNFLTSDQIAANQKRSDEIFDQLFR
jgi:ABC-type Fe3+ transport system substrate-binding protein